jgi:hypothetical protein
MISSAQNPALEKTHEFSLLVPMLFFVAGCPWVTPISSGSKDQTELDFVTRPAGELEVIYHCSSKRTSLPKPLLKTILKLAIA